MRGDIPNSRTFYMYYDRCSEYKIILVTNACGK